MRRACFAGSCDGWKQKAWSTNLDISIAAASAAVSFWERPNMSFGKILDGVLIVVGIVVCALLIWAEGRGSGA